MDKLKISDKAIKEVRAVREVDERADQEEEMDKWFKGLNELQICFIMMKFWDDASYKEKEQFFERYK